ncbi:MAG: 16S rRNA (adenine(1518)-N(6)/adenine(1519)-N(6))-dimethyltransferase RsmA [Verrucomicrobiales bacterium]|nr:16S rRNA (adenine(1518)-N(6)/adenine(1519)-N(6))-dimethyltransferase RsmA [Verrucomicrobiales bacterium]
MARTKHRPPLGQHFLHSQGVLARIAASVPISPGDLVIEIGPGEGALTEHLLERGARVTALEIDPRLAAGLRERLGPRGNLEIIETDVLQADLGKLIAQRSDGLVHLVGNLPYYITSPILRAAFSASARIREAVFLMQKEVALRVTARKGSRDCGFLSVLCELHSERELLFTVAAGAFRPPPKVTSAVVRLNMRQDSHVPEKLLAFLQAAFRQPRKTLLNNLSVLYPRADLAGLAESRRRAQEMSLEELTALWRQLEPAPGA